MRFDAKRHYSIDHHLPHKEGTEVALQLRVREKEYDVLYHNTDVLPIAPLSGERAGYKDIHLILDHPMLGGGFQNFFCRNFRENNHKIITIYTRKQEVGWN